MEMTVSASDNINGTLILPIYEGTQSIAEDSERGLSQTMKSQINRVLADGDFKAKRRRLPCRLSGEKTVRLFSLD